MIWLIIGGGLLLILLAVIYAESFLMLRVRRESLGGGVRIAHIADLHQREFGNANEKLCAEVAAQKPDIILVSGDLISRCCTDFTTARKTLGELCGIAPVYMVRGNHEADLEQEFSEKFTEAVRSTGTVLLENETKSIEINGRSLNICGMELSRTVYKKSGGYKNLDVITAEDIRSAIGEKPQGETILLVHNPLFAEVYAQWGADYAVCGHVHGGAVCIPFTRIGLLSPERKFFPRYSKGVYSVGGMKLLLSGGLGKLRLFNPPEIVIYDI